MKTYFMAWKFGDLTGSFVCEIDPGRVMTIVEIDKFMRDRIFEGIPAIDKGEDGEVIATQFNRVD